MGVLMNKYIFVTNGMARSGKDTFAALMNEFVPTKKYSSIDYIKEIAKLCGWNGQKNEKSRKFLSDLKVLTSQYNDLPFKMIQKQIDGFNKDEKYNVLLIDIREPEEIRKLCDKYKDVKTILIKRNSVKTITSNMADAGVFNYNYDFVIENNGTLNELKSVVKKFVMENISIEN